MTEPQQPNTQPPAIQQPDTQAQGERGAASLPAAPSAMHDALPVPPKVESRERDQPVSVRPDSAAADVDARTKFITSIHEYIRDNIRLADQKATFFFTGATALLAFLYRSNVSARWLKRPTMWNLLDMVAFVAMFGLAVGAFLAIVVVVPRTPGSKRGFVFWEAIAEYRNGREYADDLSMLSPATLFQVKAEHSFDLARVCRSKYKWLRGALWVGVVGLAASLIVFLFL